MVYETEVMPYVKIRISSNGLANGDRIPDDHRIKIQYKIIRGEKLGTMTMRKGWKNVEYVWELIKN